MSQCVLDGVELAPLPGHAGHGGAMCRREVCLFVADANPHAVHAACLEALDELPPVRVGLACRHAAAGYGPLAVGGGAAGGEYGTGDDGPSVPCLFVSGVEDLS